MNKTNIYYYIYFLTLLFSLIKSNFVLDSYLNSPESDFNMDLSIILKTHFKYELRHKSGKLPEIFNELLDFNTDLIKTDLDKDLDKDSKNSLENVIKKKINLIFSQNSNDLLTLEDFEYKLEMNSHKIQRDFTNIFTNFYALEYKARGSKVNHVSDELITTTVHAIFSTGEYNLFNEEDDWIEAIKDCRTAAFEGKSNNVIHDLVIKPIKTYFSDIDEIRTNPEEVIIDWLNKTFYYVKDNFRGRENELIKKFMVLLKTLVFRDKKHVDNNGVARACEFIKNMYNSEAQLGEFYAPIMNAIFEFLVTQRSLVERETILELIMAKVFTDGHNHNRKLRAIVNYEYKFYTLSDWFNNDTSNENSANLIKIATFNLLRNISSKKLIKLDDYILICNNFLFLTNVDVNRVLMIEKFDYLFTFKSEEIIDHPFVCNVIYNSVMNFSADMDIISDSKSSSIQYNNYLLNRIVYSVVSGSPLSDVSNKYGVFLQLWNLLKSLRDFSQRGEEDFVFLNGQPTEDPLPLLSSRYEDLLNYMVPITQNNGSEFEINMVNGVTIKREKIIEMFKLSNKRLI